MSKSQLFQPDAEHLEQLKANATNLYNVRTECRIHGREQSGSVEKFEVQTLQSALDLYADLIKKGYTPLPESEYLPSVEKGPFFDWITLHLKKPAKMIKDGLAKIHAAVEENYLAELEHKKATAVAREVSLLMAGKRRKEEEARAEALAIEEAAEYARIEAEVLAALNGTD